MKSKIDQPWINVHTAKKAIKILSVYYAVCYEPCVAHPGKKKPEWLEKK